MRTDRGTAVRLLDNVIDISRYPLPEQETEAKTKRRIGLGITGLADALLFCGTAYGSGPAVALTRRWLEIIKREAYRASAGIAAEKGVCPAYDPQMLDRPNLANLDAETRAMIAENGLRNGCLTSIAPTGTTSLLAEVEVISATCDVLIELGFRNFSIALNHRVIPERNRIHH